MIDIVCDFSVQVPVHFSHEKKQSQQRSNVFRRPLRFLSVSIWIERHDRFDRISTDKEELNSK